MNNIIFKLEKFCNNCDEFARSKKKLIFIIVTNLVKLFLFVVCKISHHVTAFF